MNFNIKAKKYDSVSEPQAELAEGLLNLSLDYLPNIPPALLDVGCGTGLLSLELAGMFPASLDCLDVSENMLSVCREKLQENFPNLKWRLFQNDAENFEADIKYDAIYCSAAIQWFSDILKFLSMAKKSLKPCGILCIGAFGEKTLGELRDAYFEATGRQVESSAKFLSLNKLTAIFKKAGFELEDSAECIYVQNFESPAAALKTIGNMGVAGISKKPLTVAEAKKLKEFLPVNFSWELMAMIFQAKQGCL